MTSDAIVLSVTWYNLGARKASAVKGPSFSNILLRDGEACHMNSRQSTKAPTQVQYTFGTLDCKTFHFPVAISDSLRKHTVHAELFASYFHPTFRVYAVVLARSHQ